MYSSHLSLFLVCYSMVCGTHMTLVHMALVQLRTMATTPLLSLDAVYAIFVYGILVVPY